MLAASRQALGPVYGVPTSFKSLFYSRAFPWPNQQPKHQAFGNLAFPGRSVSAHREGRVWCCSSSNSSNSIRFSWPGVLTRFWFFFPSGSPDKKDEGAMRLRNSEAPVGGGLLKRMLLPWIGGSRRFPTSILFWLSRGALGGLKPDLCFSHD